MRDVPVLCPLKGTAAGTCTLPHVDGRKQDATPDFLPCLCQIQTYRRHGNSGTGRIRSRRLTGHCTTAPAETQRQAGAQPRWLSLFPLAVNLRTGGGIPASVTFSLIYGAYGRLYGSTVAARRPGCAYEHKNLLISEKRGKSL